MKYELRTKPGFAGPRRRRAGIEVVAGERIIVDLTSDQLKEIKADDMLVLKEVKEEKKADKKTAKDKKMVDNQEEKQLSK